MDTSLSEWDHTFASLINLDMSVSLVAASLRPAWIADLEINDQNRHRHHWMCDFKQDWKK